VGNAVVVAMLDCEEDLAKYVAGFGFGQRFRTRHKPVQEILRDIREYLSK
jgi:hypothetical protein